MMQVPSVLIVDDDATHGRMLVEALREAGWDAAVATGVTEAVALPRSSAYTAVVSDIRMSSEDGFELLRAVRTGEGSPPVVVMSSFGTEGSSQEALAAGAFAFLPKPFYVDDLLTLLARAHREAGSPA